MLTQETKRKIDSARQILVGKVPDPKAQIDQITTALIYKFMDDMDKDAMELGGKARFFTNGFEKYAWSKILDPKLGGYDRLELYAEAITKLWQNNHLPQLFRDIFKDAFLPYRSPETLSLFLKEINGFTYNHSEDLGDAFEYLLSIMSSQGDAGQFRTPRHIIDFITEVVDPKKDESILDPACGTAGFLISAYKHILKQHDGKDDPDRKEKPLTPDDKKRLMNNLVGYDISPDMVKLSKVNMYLHGFAEPKIYEYDTLSSDEKWDEMYDVIMANPPFMSPKGGIRPHKRFSVQANRAEVLFVDYIKEHLRPNGRAGVIVPEGIIFKNDIAYKQLRKLLVEDGLFAVVSLPAGVFNPYSGVKTSILFFDNSLAKLAKNILFVKLNSDGYDLGAQRKEIKENDLPRAVELFKKYIDFIKTNKTSTNQGLDFILGNQDLADLFVLHPNDFHPAGSRDLSNEKAWELRNKLSEFFQTIEKEDIAKGGNYNLSGDRYKQVIANDNQKWPMVELGAVADVFVDGNWIESKDQSPDGIRLIQTGNVGIGEYLDKDGKARYISEDTFARLNCTEVKPGDVLVSRLPDPVGRACIVPDLGTKMITAVDCTIIRFNKIKILPEYFIAISRSNSYFEELSKYLTGSSRRRISRSNLAKVRIPMTSLDEQRKIVDHLDSLNTSIEANTKENNQLKRLQLELISGTWLIGDPNRIAISAKEESVLFSLLSDCLQMIELMSDDSHTHVYFEHLILSLRELVGYMQRYFSEEIDTSLSLKVKKIVLFRNAICHRSSGLSFMNSRLIIQGGFNIKNEDIEIQYGKTKLYLLADVVSLYKKFRQTVASSSLLDRLAKYPSWQVDERKLSEIEANIVGNIKSNIMKRLAEK